MTRVIAILSMLCAALGVLLLGGAPPGAAAPAILTFDVTSSVDAVDDDVFDGACHTSPAGPAAGLCTLRAAVMEANRASGVGATINLPAGIYTLTISASGSDGETNGDLNLITPTVGSPVLNLVGAGAATTIIDANQIDRVLFVHSGRQATISGVTVRHGYTTSSGGGLYNQGTLTVTNSIFSQNYADYGGGLFNHGVLTLHQSTVSQNDAGLNGGGIRNDGPLNLTQSTLSGNTAGSNGGGIFNEHTLFVTNSTLSGNRANYLGGGIFNAFSVNVYNTTIVFNEADADADVTGGFAGGVYNLQARTFNMINTLLAGNYVSGMPVYDECYGTLASYGTNRIGLAGQGGVCTITQVGMGSWTALNSQYTLGPLQNNGGPTWTHALLAGSNAIDAGDLTRGCVDQNSIPLATDQRGAERVIGARCDIGAFEYRPPLYLPLIRR